MNSREKRVVILADAQTHMMPALAHEMARRKRRGDGGAAVGNGAGGRARGNGEPSSQIQYGNLG